MEAEIREERERCVQSLAKQRTQHSKEAGERADRWALEREELQKSHAEQIAALQSAHANDQDTALQDRARQEAGFAAEKAVIEARCAEGKETMRVRCAAEKTALQQQHAREVAELRGALTLLQEDEGRWKEAEGERVRVLRDKIEALVEEKTDLQQQHVRETEERADRYSRDIAAAREEHARERRALEQEHATLQAQVSREQSDTETIHLQDLARVRRSCEEESQERVEQLARAHTEATARWTGEKEEAQRKHGVERAEAESRAGDLRAQIEDLKAVNVTYLHTHQRLRARIAELELRAKTLYAQSKKDMLVNQSTVDECREAECRMEEFKGRDGGCTLFVPSFVCTFMRLIG